MGICDLAPYTPPVRFSGLQLSDATSVTEVDEMGLVQHSAEVCTPSDISSLSKLLAGGFSDTYTRELTGL